MFMSVMVHPKALVSPTCACICGLCGRTDRGAVEEFIPIQCPVSVDVRQNDETVRQ